ncbi:MAG: hypothetical protein IPI07_06240 [Flavobacteriales bacterium]|nr:hypothetical protein [Flavobacteriales bacterium]
MDRILEHVVIDQRLVRQEDERDACDEGAAQEEEPHRPVAKERRYALHQHSELSPALSRRPGQPSEAQQRQREQDRIGDPMPQSQRIVKDQAYAEGAQPEPSEHQWPGR